MKSGSLMALIGCAAFVATPYFIFASVRSKSEKTRETAKARIAELDSHHVRDVTSGYIVLFPKMAIPIGGKITIPAGPDRHVMKFVNVGREDVAKEKSELLKRLQSRVDWFQTLDRPELPSLGMGVAYGTENVDVQAQIFVVFGVEVVETRDTFGGRKYRATRPASVMIPNHSRDLLKPVPLPYYSNYSVDRSDFVNPKDIDWMYEVGDYSKFDTHQQIGN